VTLPPEDRPELPELPQDFDFDTEFAKAFGAEPPTTGAAPTRPKALVAVVLTPVSSAPALAGLCAMAGIDAHVVPTSRGALATRVIERDGETDDSLAELLGEAPEIATTMAATLSRTSRYGAVLLVSRLGEGDEGLVGTIAASQWNAGKRTEDPVSAGLVLAQADDVVEQLLLGAITPEAAEGAIAPGKLPPWQARRLFKKTQRKPRP
jgi:hypothetical protein